MAPQSLSFSLQSTLATSSTSVCSKTGEGDTRQPCFYLSKYCLFSESAVNHQGVWGPTWHFYRLCDFWQVPSSLWDSVFPSIETEIRATFGHLSLCSFESPCQWPQRVQCTFPACFLPHPSVPPLLLADKLLLVSCKLHSPHQMGSPLSLRHRPQSEDGLLSLLVRAVPGPRLTFPYGTRANGHALPFSLSLSL